MEGFGFLSGNVNDPSLGGSVNVTSSTPDVPTFDAPIPWQIPEIPYLETNVGNIGSTQNDPSADTNNGSSALDIINSLGQLALGALVLTRLPTNRLPSVGTGAKSTTVVKPTALQSITSSNSMLLIAAFLLIIVLFMMAFKK